MLGGLPDCIMLACVAGAKGLGRNGGNLFGVPPFLPNPFAPATQATLCWMALF